MRVRLHRFCDLSALHGDPRCQSYDGPDVLCGRIAADGSYSTGPFLAWLRKRNGTPHLPVLERKHQTNGKYDVSHFHYDAERDSFTKSQEPNNSTAAPLGIFQITQFPGAFAQFLHVIKLLLPHFLVKQSVGVLLPVKVRPFSTVIHAPGGGHYIRAVFRRLRSKKARMSRPAARLRLLWEAATL